MLTTRVFDELEDLRRTFDRFLDQPDWNYPVQRKANGSNWSFAPAVETGWTKDYLNLRFVLPAVSKDDIEVTTQGNQVTIRGERRFPQGFGDENATYHRMPYGKFERAVDLPNGVDAEHLEAHMHDGVLDLRIPVAEAMKPKKVEIQASETKKAIAA
ncbi:MAG TPA: Hsp20/alpha crystallin family protein [Bryobacterales bacterium]|nr:Hsp20/alpha crystallin family protein [Bryobacterales bacterium]